MGAQQWVVADLAFGLGSSMVSASVGYRVK
jgi:hypothetical protein